ncbi:MAG: hypothetical protein PF446_08290, partial [Oleiagrimonas sp.]|nr:hypothetical protein [Oleiagrimonas sp.]
EAAPHLKGESSAFVIDMPEMSYADSNMEQPGKLMRVSAITLKNGHKYSVMFGDIVKKIVAAANKSHWSSHFRFLGVAYGGEGAPDYLVVSYAGSWAELGQKSDPPMWDMVAKVYGKKQANQMRAQIGETILNQSSHLDSYSKDMSYIPSGH